MDSLALLTDISKFRTLGCMCNNYVKFQLNRFNRLAVHKGHTFRNTFDCIFIEDIGYIFSFDITALIFFSPIFP